MIKVVAMVALAGALSQKSNNLQLSGEYFYNTKIGFETLAEGEKASVSAVARKFCGNRGYNSALAFYLDATDAPQVTDIFCSNLQQSRETVTPARIVIARERKERGLPLREDVLSLLAKTEHLRFMALKKTDASSL